MSEHTWLSELAKKHADAQASPHPLQASRPLPIRTPARGELVAQFFLPLDLAKPRNRTRGTRFAWMAKKERDDVYNEMSRQYVFENAVKLEEFEPPVSGRPLVRCIRYSTTEPDSTAGWAKVPVDCLQPGGTRLVTKTKKVKGEKVKYKVLTEYEGLDIISSDSPKHTDVVEWWEPAKRGKGFAVIEVWASPCEDCECPL